MGNGSYGFVSLAFTNTDDTPSPTIPSLIAVKSSRLKSSRSLRNERKFLKMFEDCPQIIRCFGSKSLAKMAYIFTIWSLNMPQLGA